MTTMSFRCKAIVFDLDGVLVDSADVIERHWRQWADAHDIPFETVDQVRHGRQTVEIIREVAPHLDAEAEAQKKVEQESRDTDGLKAFDGAAELLRSLPAERWAIATSGTRQTATSRIAHTDLPAPQTLVTADDVAAGKPEPDPYQLAAERLGVDPSDCVVLEDAPAGVRSARQAGSTVIAVASTSSPEDLAEADVVVNRLANVSVEGLDEGFHVRWQNDSD